MGWIGGLLCGLLLLLTTAAYGQTPTLWFLAFNINGMMVISFEPFQSEEGCRMAARQVNVAVFECIEAPDPDPAS